MMRKNKTISDTEAKRKEMDREREIDCETAYALSQAAQRIVEVAQNWEMGDGMSDENPAMEVAGMMLRQLRILKQQHYTNTHAGMSVMETGKFDLPRAVRTFFRDLPVSRESRPKAEK